MEIKNVYPPVKRRSRAADIARTVMKWILATGCAASVIVNILTGSPWWSATVVTGCCVLWYLFLSPRLVESNAIGFFIRLTGSSCLMLSVIGYTLSPGWAGFVIPMVSGGGLLISMILLLSDKEGQKNNVHPALLLSVVNTAGSLIYFFREETIFRDRLVSGISALTGLVFIIVAVSVLGMDFFRELRRRFHLK